MVDAVRRLQKLPFEAVKNEGFSLQTITPIRFAVGVTGARPCPRAEPKPATGVGNESPVNLPAIGEGLARWNPRLSRREGGQIIFGTFSQVFLSKDLN
ncbi:hypothetical protein OCC_14080 [Thermococcus litoralis DSM 5473]|uniref:Uncharacterized protein n=1 Tax=Thermococcus litoralis (strain ATCC 51850 / DSM 5473 / JCM 8560 / NS-C) TaxID=523849 RepID=S5ZB62_THELN|nr:hypothetical protein OCC_14080 [Thermococcus litoralis DSM 5473]